MSAAEMAARLDLKRCGGSWRGSCPSCGYWSTFSLRAGRMRPVFTCFNGCTPTELASTVRRAVDGTWSPPLRSISDETAKRERARSRALALWAGSSPAAGTLADLYLAEARALAGLAGSIALRFRADRCRIGPKCEVQPRRKTVSDWICVRKP